MSPCSGRATSSSGGIGTPPYRHSPSGRSSSRAHGARRSRNRGPPAPAHARVRGHARRRTPRAGADRRRHGGRGSLRRGPAPARRRRGRSAARSRAIRGAQRCGIQASLHGINSCPAIGTRAQPVRCVSPGPHRNRRCDRVLTQGHGQTAPAADPRSACWSPARGARYRRTRA